MRSPRPYAGAGRDGRSREACAPLAGEVMRPTRSYLICTTPRSGSWLLADGLRATGVAGRPEEYLRTDWLMRYRATGTLTYEHRILGLGPITSTGDLAGFLAAVLDIGTTPHGVFGA